MPLCDVLKRDDHLIKSTLSRKLGPADSERERERETALETREVLTQFAAVAALCGLIFWRAAIFHLPESLTISVSKKS